MKRLASASLLALAILTPLFLSGCKRIVASIDNITLTPSVGSFNEPQGSIADVPALLPRVYLVGQVFGASASTIVTVRWYRGGDVLSTEVFRGQRNDSNPYDFSTSPNLASKNYFASVLERPSDFWPVGDYKVEVYLGSALVKSLSFSIVTESQAELTARQNAVKQILISDTLTNNTVAANKLNLDSSVDNIYVAVILVDQPTGDKMRLVVDYIPQAVTIVAFTQDVQAGPSLFILSRSSLAPVLGANFWKSGTYQVSLYIDDILAQKANFKVK